MPLTFHSHSQDETFNRAVIPCVMDGDVILREGRGWVSKVFSSFSVKEKKYSHAGFIIHKNGKPFVYHYFDDGFHIESIETYTSRWKCKSYAVYRYALTADLRNALAKRISAEAAGKAFDLDFDLQTDEKLYCTEWIYKCLQEQNVILPVTKMNSQTYIAPDNLYINGIAQKINYYEHEN